MKKADNKNTGGNTMSLTKSATTRLSLLAGSSLALTSLTAAASLGLALAPTAAFAANECGNPAANGTAADTFVCPVAVYPTGIQHTSAGDLSVTVQSGSNFGTGGVVTTAGTSTDDVSVQLAGTVTANSQTQFNTAFPRLIDIRSQTGDVAVDVTVARPGSGGSFIQVQANNAGTTHGIYAVSQGGGDVRVTSTNQANTGISATGAASVAAIEARSIGGGDVTINTGGAGNLQLQGGQHGVLAATDGAGSLNIVLGTASNPGSAQGRLYGILASASGTGTLTIAGAASTSGSAGLYGIHATTGGGLLTITGSGTSSAAGGVGVYMDAGGDVAFTGSASGGLYGIHAPDIVAGTTTTINLTGSAMGGTRGILAAGAGALNVNVVGTVGTHNYDFSGMAAPVEVTVRDRGIWNSQTSSTVSGSNFGITIDPGGALFAGTESSNSTVLEAPTVITFAVPDFVLTNAGLIIAGPQSEQSNGIANYEGDLRLEGLGELHHSGLVLLGALKRDNTAGTQLGGSRTDITDGVPDDILTMTGGTWVGEEGRVMFDVDLTKSQSDCTRAPVTGNLAAADCLRLLGVTTEGVTYVTINEIFPGDRIRPPEGGIVLVEVTGGTSAQGHFAVDPNLPGFTPLFGGSQDRGLYHYVIGYNEDTQQHSLFGFLGAGSYQFAQYATAAHSLWRVSTGTALERQADFRQGIDERLGGGAWLRVSGEVADRDAFVENVGGGQTFTFDNTHRQTSYAVTGGLDLISESDGNMSWVAGLMTGYTYADIEYDAWVNTGQLDGFSVGAYTSFAGDGLFLDAAINANRAILKNDMPGLDMFPVGSILDTIVVTSGAHVEAGWRLPVGGFAFVEPLASVSYVRSKFDDLEVAAADPVRPGVDVEFDNPVSARASVGGRAGMEQDFGFLRAQFTVLGRLWNEFEGENTVLINNQGVVDAVVDDFSGQFNELGLGASVKSPGGAVSGFLNLGGKFGDDYQAKTGTVGVRVAW